MNLIGKKKSWRETEKDKEYKFEKKEAEKMNWLEKSAKKKKETENRIQKKKGQYVRESSKEIGKNWKRIYGGTWERKIMSMRQKVKKR